MVRTRKFTYVIFQKTFFFHVIVACTHIFGRFQNLMIGVRCLHYLKHFKMLIHFKILSLFF